MEFKRQLHSESKSDVQNGLKSALVEVSISFCKQLGCGEERRRENYIPVPKDRGLNGLGSSVTLSALEMLPQISIEDINHSAGEKWAKVSLHDPRLNRKAIVFVVYLKKILFKKGMRIHDEILVQIPLHYRLNFYLDFHSLAENCISTE